MNFDDPYSEGYDPVDFDLLLNAVKGAIDDAMKNQGHMNILIAGRTGVGKSTLINAIFSGNMAETGQGRPVTTSTREVSKTGIPVSIWDTRGLEMAAFHETLTELEKVIRDRARDQDPCRHIHVAWLCIQEDGRRVEEAETALHEMLSKHMPVLGVITKAKSNQGFRSEVQRLLPHAKNVVRVHAIREEFDDGHVVEAMGLKELVEVTLEILPEGHKRAFVAAQKASIEQKKKVGQQFIAGAAALALAAGASPIPFSDAFVLVPIQIGMLAKITIAFGLEPTSGYLTTLLGAATGTTGATFAGRAIVANLIKFFPGLGTAAGAAISGTTAAALTTLMGEAYLAAIAAAFMDSGAPPELSAVVEEFRRRWARKNDARPVGALPGG